MKAKLEFELPEDREEFNLAVNGNNWHDAMYELDQWLRGKIKYNNEEFTETEEELLQTVRDQLHEVLDDNSITFNI